MANKSTDATNDEPSKGDDSQQDIELLIKLDPDDSDMPEIVLDDVSKLDITIDNNDKQEVEDETNDTLKQKEIKKKHKSDDEITAAKTTANETNAGNKCTTVSSSKSKSNFIWVSNVSCNIKAADLKKLFSQVGKVSSVKILTNGKQFYGYVSMENVEAADKCVTDLHNTLFQGEKISVSRRRPDLGAKKSENAKKKSDKEKKVKVEEKESQNEKQIKKKSLEDGEIASKEETNGDTGLNVGNKKHIPDKKSVSDKNGLNKENKTVIEEQGKEILKLKSKIDALYSTNNKLKRRHEDIQRLYNSITGKYNHLKNELKKAKIENREERRRLSLEKENFEKQKKTELSRLSEERSDLSKELCETKKLKESLKNKIEEFKHQKSSKRSRSPLQREVISPRRRSSPLSRNSGGLYRGDQRHEKKYRRTDRFSRERTPPPPNLNSEIRKRPANRVPVSRPASYYSEGGKIMSGFDFRSGHVFQSTQQAPKNSWLGAYSKEQRRTNVNLNQGNNFANVRYPGPSASNTSFAVMIPPRVGNTSHYYQNW